MDRGRVIKTGVSAEREDMTSRRRLLQGAALATLGAATMSMAKPFTARADDGGENQNDDGKGSTVLSFSTMAGIQAPFLGDAGLSIFRGVHGGGAAWVLSQARGSLTSDGHLKVRVRGLVLDPASVPAPNGGTNPIPFFVAIVSGFSTDPVNPINLVTPMFPATKAGDATIEALLTLPHPFFAPIVFVASSPIGMPPAPRWFAVTGLQ
jgi:hypothetical protein